MNALACHDVGQGDACGEHFHAHFTILRLGPLFFSHPKFIGPAVVSDDDARAEEIESAIVALAIEQPAFGQVRIAKYHVVFIPKYRKKAIFGKIKKNLGAVFHDLARRRECRIEVGHLMADHVHMLVSIPPKYSVAEVIGFIKGKSSIWIAQNIERKAKNFTGHKFWARGYFVSTVGRDEETIRAYIRNQELQDRQMDQLVLIP